MEIGSLLEVMTQEVAQRRESILDAARSDAARILADARKEAARRRAEAIRVTEGEFAQAAQRSRERAEAEAEMIVLTTKDRITDEILSTVAGELERIVAGPEFSTILEALLEELLRHTAGGETVLTPPTQVEHCRHWLAAYGYQKLEVKGTDELRDGVAIQDARRSFRITNTLSVRLAKQEGRLRKLCLERLMPDGSPPASRRSE